MSAARFTPGPWCWQQCGDKEDAPVVGIAYLESDTDCKNALSGCLPDFDEQGHEIAYYRDTIACEISSCDGCSASANAALIAAAPELYEALEDLAERMLGAFPSLASTPEAGRAKAALAKARGES